MSVDAASNEQSKFGTCNNTTAKRRFIFSGKNKKKQIMIGLYLQTTLEGSRLNIGQNSLGHVLKNINEFCTIKYNTKKIFIILFFST